MSDQTPGRMPELSMREQWSALIPEQRSAIYRWLVASTVLLLLFWDTAVSIEAIWRRSGNFTHGYLILPIAAYMLWMRRDRLTAILPSPTLTAMLPMLGAAVLWLLARMSGVLFAEQLALIFMWQALILAVFGWRWVWTALFPVLYLLLAVPFGQGLEPYLQDFTAWFAVKTLRLTQIPVFWEGRFLQLPNGNFEVAEACSGMRYLIASLALGCLFADMNYTSVRRKLAFIVLSLVFPIVANGIRAYLIVILAHLSDNKYGAGVDHLIYGWVFFGIVMFILFWIGGFWRQPPAPAQADAVPEVGAKPVNAYPAIAVMLLIAALTPLAFQWFTAKPTDADKYQLTAPSSRAWSYGAEQNERWQPDYRNPDLKLRGAFRGEAKVVEFYSAYYIRQKQKKELISSENRMFNDERWRRIAERNLTIETQHGPLRVHETTMRAMSGPFPRPNRMIWHWFWMDGKESINPVEAKLIEMQALLRRSPNGSAVIAVAADYSLTTDSAKQQLTEFLNAKLPELRVMLEKVPPQ